jgi:hypothetical protein
MCGNLVHKGFQAALRDVNPALIFALLLFPCSLLLSPLVVYAFRILLLRPNLLLGGF